MKKRIFALSLCMLLVMAALCGCVSEQTSAEMEQQCRIVLNALIANNADAAWEIIDPQYCTREDFDAFVAAVAPDFAGVDSYELKQNGFRTGIYNGIREVELTYMVIDGEEVICYVSVARIGDSGKLAGFNIEWVEGNVTTKTLSAIVIIVIVLFVGFGLVAIAAVIIIVVVVRKNKAKKRRQQELYMQQYMQQPDQTLSSDAEETQEESKDE